MLKFKKSVYNFLYKRFRNYYVPFPNVNLGTQRKRIYYDTWALSWKIDQINTDSKELRVDVGIDGNLANYNLISLEKLSKYLEKHETNNLKNDNNNI